MNKKYITAFLIVIIFFLGVFLFVKHFSKNSIITTSPPVAVAETSENIKYVEIGGQKVKVDLALTVAEQEHGLSGRLSLSPDTGMLFVFNEPSTPLFWMKVMNFPIDMIWITPDMKVDYIKKDALPDLYPQTYGPSASDGEAEYVLETTSDFSDNNNLKIGDSVGFIYQ